jgi:hypothetical protein
MPLKRPSLLYLAVCNKTKLEIALGQIDSRVVIVQSDRRRTTVSIKEIVYYSVLLV